MKKATPRSPAGGLTAALAVLLLAGATARAADTMPGDKPAFKAEELEQLLAPIALYPDDVLSQILMASTYPLEVVQAERWVKANKDLTGDALTSALEAQGWDPSVKSLINFPTVIAMMSENLDVTVKIGDAFIAQQQEVLDTVQKLRAEAQKTGNLKTTPEQTIVIQQQGPTQVIVIQPTNPKIIYIPTYSPIVYYAVWPYPAYPPVVYYPPGYVVRPGYAFAAGVAVVWLGATPGAIAIGIATASTSTSIRTSISTPISTAADTRPSCIPASPSTSTAPAPSSIIPPTARAWRIKIRPRQPVRPRFDDTGHAGAEAYRGRPDTGTNGANNGGFGGSGVGNPARPSGGTVGSGGSGFGSGASPRPSPTVSTPTARPSVSTPAARPSAFQGIDSGGGAVQSQSQPGSSSLGSSRSSSSGRR